MTEDIITHEPATGHAPPAGPAPEATTALPEPAPPAPEAVIEPSHVVATAVVTPVEDLAVEDELLQVGRVLGDRVHHRVAEGFALLVPGPFPQLVGRVLHEAGQDVLAGRRHRRVGQGGDDHVDVRARGELAVLGLVVGPLHVFDAG